MPQATVFTLLDADWALVQHSSEATEALRRWRRDDQALASLGDLSALVAAAERRGVPERTDAILSALARRAPDDGIAARVLLQLLLPGARAMARRLWWIGTPDETAAAVIEAVYERIRTYPWQRRPAKIAANVLADATQRLLRARRGWLDEVPYEELDERALTAVQGVETNDSAEELIGLLDWAQRGGHLTPAEVRLIAQTRILDTSLEDLSRDEGIAVNSMRRRRQRAERKLADAVAKDGATGGPEVPRRIWATACA